MTESINANVLGLCCGDDGFCPWELFELNENSFVVDLGAFRGDFSKYIYETYNCRVDAYEPLGVNISVGHPKFTLIKKPVFDGSKVMFTNNGKSNSHISEEGELIESVDIADITKEHIDLMKVNIEGAELTVLKRANLNNVDQLLVEFHLFSAENKMKAIINNEILNLVNHILSYGYRAKMINDAPAFFFYGKS